jgi:hypothetical protein
MDSVANTVLLSGFGANGVFLTTYTAFAKQTKPANNTTVLHGESGLGDVFMSDSFALNRAVLLGESLTMKVLSNSFSAHTNNLTLNNVVLLSYMLSTAGGYQPDHSSNTLAAPTNNSPAVKSLMYQVDSNSQASLNFAYKEMIYDVTWGDDNKIDINDGDNTKTDLNGNTVQYGTHELAIPYGWIKNEV